MRLQAWKQLGLSVLGVWAWVAPLWGATLTVSCGAEGTSYYACKEAAQAWATSTGHSVWVISVSPDNDVAVDNYQRMLHVGERALDLLPVEMAWIPALAEQLSDMRSSMGRKALAPYLGSAVQAFQFDNRVVALPWYLDVSVLYYRTDLLQQSGYARAETWRGIFSQADKIQRAQRVQNEAFWGLTFHAGDSQALSRLAIEWFDAAGALPLIDRFGRVGVKADEHAPTLALWSSVVGQVVPRESLIANEDESRRIFQAGNAAFLRGGAHLWPLINGPGSKVEGLVGVSRLPTGRPKGVHSMSLGGWGLAVPRRSKQPALAVELARYLTSVEQQRKRAMLYSYPPALRALYEDRDLRSHSPSLAVVRESLPFLVHRPIHESGKQYQTVSYTIAERLRAALTSRQVASQLEALRDDLNAMRPPGGFDGAETVARARRFQRDTCTGPPSIAYIICR